MSNEYTPALAATLTIAYVTGFAGLYDLLAGYGDAFPTLAGVSMLATVATFIVAHLMEQEEGDA